MVITLPALDSGIKWTRAFGNFIFGWYWYIISDLELYCICKISGPVITFRIINEFEDLMR